MSVEKVELGRRLFYDQRLSINERASCAICHQQQLAFTDGLARASGATGELHARSSMSLVNVAYNSNYTWASRALQSLEEQIPIPLFNVQPIELGMRGHEDLLVDRLSSDATYTGNFQRAFPESKNPIEINNVIKALSSFVRTIISADSAFDRRLFLDDQGAMSESALQGMRLFYSDDLRCGACHSGRTVGGTQAASARPPIAEEFHNTGLYNIGGRNEYPQTDTGLRAESGDPGDDGKFRAPTLRNIALTAPYMHDGSIATLSDVIDHYAAGGRAAEAQESSLDGSGHSLKSPLLTGFELSDGERSALLDFLDSLTDYSLLENPAFAAPVEPSNRR